MTQHFGSIVVELAKLRDYCLSDTHPRGRHKARVFRSRLELTNSDAELLQRLLLDAALERQDDLRLVETDEFGQRYVLDFPVASNDGTVVVRSSWIVLTGQDVLRLTSCFVL